MQAERLEKIKKVFSILDVTLVLALIVLAIGGEIVGGVSFYNMRLDLADALPVLGLYKEFSKVQRSIARNDHDQEAARRAPEILYEELTAGALYFNSQEENQPMVKNEHDKVIEVDSRTVNVTASQPEKTARVSALIRNTIIGFVTVMLVLGAWVGWALAADTVVVGIDLTTSSQVESEFKDSLDKVGEIIRDQKDPGTRIVVLGIREDSFGSPIIFDEAVPLVFGRFGQRLEEWRLRAIKKWRARKESLNPGENGSDIFGFLARAAVIFSDDPNGKSRLLVFSDMRHVGQGYNFEMARGLAKARIDELDAQGLVPKLQGVKVWIFGAHTNGLSPSHWTKLKDFWSNHLKRSGAELMMFSPSRRLAENPR
jgi:hypothetical protein